MGHGYRFRWKFEKWQQRCRYFGASCIGRKLFFLKQRWRNDFPPHSPPTTQKFSTLQFSSLHSSSQMLKQLRIVKTHNKFGEREKTCEAYTIRVLLLCRVGVNLLYWGFIFCLNYYDTTGHSNGFCKVAWYKNQVAKMLLKDSLKRRVHT